MKKAAATIILFSLISIASRSQDLNGFWKGTFNMQGCFSANNIELQLTMQGNAAAGDTYHYQDINNYVKKKFSGSYDPERKRLSVHEGIVTTFRIPPHCAVCIKNFELVYSRNGNVETLRGLWNGNVMNSSFPCGGDSIILTRIKESAFREVPEIKVDTGVVRLDFYDNATVDGDSITVKINNKVVLSHQLLGAAPVTTYVTVDLFNAFFEVEMIADNLGSIPPNTAMLIITTGETRHRLTLSASESKSARIRLVYEGREKEHDSTVQAF